MRDRLDDLYEHLLRAGLSPSRARRYVRELDEHRQDLTEHLQSEGMDTTLATAEADRRLGSFDALLLPMLADRRFQSPVSRWPVLFYLVLPLGFQAALVLAGIFTLLLASKTGLRPAMLDLGSGLALLLLAAPVLIAWFMLFSAYRRRMALRWPVVGVILGAALATALQLGVTPPLNDANGQIGLTLGTPSLLPLVTLALLSLLPLSLQPRPE